MPANSARRALRAVLPVALTLAVVAAPPPARAQSVDSAAVVATIEAFHAALAAGDSTKALSLLSDDVTILETGGVETKSDYRSGHLRGDMAYAKAVQSQRAITSVRIRGDVAWVAGTSITQGDYNGRAINSAGAELVVLSREGGAWKIRAVHWSSRMRRA